MPPFTTITTTIPSDIIPTSSQARRKRETITESCDRSYRTLWGTFNMPLKWINIIFLTSIHLASLHAIRTFPYPEKFKTVVWGFVLGVMGGFGVTGGAHRYWTHRSYRATMPLRIILVICYAIAGQNKLFNWVRDHRVHHKFSETDADPHNSNRGFFFAHVGWLMMNKHPDVVEKGKVIDCSDLYEDSAFRFHEKYFWTLKAIFCFLIPIIVPWYFWNETLYWAFIGPGITRYVINLNCTWSVNSAAHIFGNRPYDRKIQPVENITVSILALGEGWHNYHHTFPWDYKAAELGDYYNFTTYLLDLFAKIGWAYDLKTPSKELIKKIIEHHGDGSHIDWNKVKLVESNFKTARETALHSC